MTRLSPNYRFTAPVVNGDISNSELQEQYQSLVRNIATLNIMNAAAKFMPGLRYVVRKRYRGPRRQRTNDTKNQRQSMCLKQDATSVDVYVFTETRK